MCNNTFPPLELTKKEHYIKFNQDNPRKSYNGRLLEWMKNTSNDILSDIDDGFTSDEEQEDLPYDGNPEVAYRHYTELCDVNQSHSDYSSNLLDLTISEISKSLNEENGLEAQDLCHDDVVEHNSPKTLHNSDANRDKDSSYSSSAVSIENKLHGDFVTDGNKVEFSNSKIPDVLLRHFSEGVLLNTSQFIDFETIPDTSFTESIDETIINKITSSNSSHESSVIEQGAEDFEKYLLKRDEHFEFDYPGKNLLEESLSVVAKAEICRNEENGVGSKLSTEAKILEDPNHSKAAGSRNVGQKYQLERRVSSYEIKYGQGQVHYRLPDFSKVASKVKIPTRHGNVQSISVTKRSKSSNLIDKSAIIKDVLETMHPIVKEHEEETRNLDPEHVQVSLYSASLNPKITLDSGASDAHVEDSTVSNPFLWRMQVKPSLALPQGVITDLEYETKNSKSLSTTAEEKSLNLTFVQDPAEAEEMFLMLKAHTEQLKTKGEEFSKCLMKDAFSLQDQCLVFKELKECLETLEEDYLITKEKHRHLQLQSYRSGRKSIGEFDPGRKVEGEIFRLGMLLEDIKEKMDENIYSSSLSSPFATSAVLSQSKPRSPSHTLLYKNPGFLISNAEKRKMEPEMTALRKENEEMSDGLQNEMELDQSKEHSLQGDSCDLLSQLKVEDGNMGSRKSRHGRFSIVVQEETLNLVLSDSDFNSDAEDLLFSNPMITGSLSRKASEHKPKLHGAGLDGYVLGSNNLKSDVASKVPSFSRRKNIYSPALRANRYRHERDGFVCNLPERKNFVAKPHCSRLCHTFMFSPQYLTSRMYGGRSRFNSGNNINAKILNSVLDRAIETAKSMRKTTERMVQAISADLAKTHMHRSFETS